VDPDVFAARLAIQFSLGCQLGWFAWCPFAAESLYFIILPATMIASLKPACAVASSV
jgi:hypothetical protein